MKWLLVAMMAASTADLVTTELALRHPGIEEMNPFMENRAVRCAAKLGVPVFIYWATGKMSKSNKPRIIFCLGLTFSLIAFTRFYLLCFLHLQLRLLFGFDLRQYVVLNSQHQAACYDNNKYNIHAAAHRSHFLM